MSEITLYNGDCIEKMKLIPDNSVDSIVTDPPYGLTSITKRFGKENSAPATTNNNDGSFSRLSKGFMGKTWDGSGIEYNVEMWKECLRVLKPGGYLLSFGGTRTYHRMAVAIEDAGFEVRDMIEWVYGSGFPKSLNIGKAVDKLQGNERVITGSEQKAKPTFHSQNVGGKITEIDNIQITKGTSEFEGWGTALKPAHEPICMARKPLSEKTVAENVLKYGTGGINIDESRVGTEDTRQKTGGAIEGSGWGTKAGAIAGSELGRFPANLIHDNSEEVRECFPETGKSNVRKPNGKNLYDGNTLLKSKTLDTTIRGMNDNGGNASRFFKSIIYQAKVSKSERNKGMDNIESKEWKQENSPNPNRKERPFLPVKNNHPTVKPIKLMEYLIKMVTPKNGTVLDPFMGSGSTGVASKLGGFNFIGIEKETEYCDIAKARMNTIVDVK